MIAPQAAGLFSHPDVDQSATRSDSQADDQRSYTNLFREPAGARQDAEGEV